MAHRSQYKNKFRPQAKQQQDLPRQKKHLGQNFLVSQDPINTMLSAIAITPDTTVVEIGCGNGILTRAILDSKCKALHVIEIDPDWANHIYETISDPRMTIHNVDALAFDFTTLKADGGRLVLLANLPYVITFPLFEKFSKHHDLFDDGMVMVQEEAAERMSHTSGRRYGAVSIYLQYFFTFTAYERVPPHLFVPAPKVMSRLVRFQPKSDLMPMDDAAAFWLFVRECFVSPRQTIGNNLKRTYRKWQVLSEETLKLRAQQMTVAELYTIWKSLQ